MTLRYYIRRGGDLAFLTIGGVASQNIIYGWVPDRTTAEQFRTREEARDFLMWLAPDANAIIQDHVDISRPAPVKSTNVPSAEWIKQETERLEQIRLTQRRANWEIKTGTDPRNGRPLVGA
jgi:hypothetical protein